MENKKNEEEQLALELFKLSKIIQILEIRIQQIENQLGPVCAKEIQDKVKQLFGEVKLPEFPKRDD